MSEEWTVVGKDKRKKKEKDKEEKDKKEEKRKVAQAPEKPVFHSQTIYSMYDDLLEEKERIEREKVEKKKMEEENRVRRKKEYELESAKIQVTTTLVEEEPVKYVPIKKAPPKVVETPNYKKIFKKVQDITDKLSEDDLKQQIGTITSNYPNDVSVQLRSLAEYFESLYSKSPIFMSPSFTLEPLTIEQLVSRLPEGVVSVLVEWMEDFGQKAQETPAQSDHLSDFLWFLFETFVTNEAKQNKRSLNGSGLWILLQFIIQKFPYTLAKITPHLQTKYMTKSKYGYTLKKKPESVYIIRALNNALLSNGKIALYGWLNLMMPTLLNENTDSGTADNILKFIDDLFAKYPKETVRGSDTGSNEEFVSSEAIVSLIQALEDNAKPKLQPKLKKLSQQIFDYTVFLSSSHPHYYFESLLGLIGAPEVNQNEGKELKKKEEKKEEKEGEGEEAKEPSTLVMNLLSISLMRDTGCNSVVASIYTKQFKKIELVFTYITQNWDKLQTQSKKLGESAQHLIDVANTVKQINESILNNKYKENGKQAGVKLLGIHREQLQESTDISNTLLSILQVTAKKEERKKKGKGCCYYLFLIALLAALLYALVAYNIIPPQYVQKAKALVPPEITRRFEEFVPGIRNKIPGEVPEVVREAVGRVKEMQIPERVARAAEKVVPVVRSGVEKVVGEVQQVIKRFMK